MGPYGLQSQSCTTPDRSGGGPVAVEVTVWTEDSVLVGGAGGFDKMVDSALGGLGGVVGGADAGKGAPPVVDGDKGAPRKVD